MKVEYWGHIIDMPEEPDIVGSCSVCGGEIYDYEVEECECGALIHRACKGEFFICERCNCITGKEFEEGT